jgi:energy-coupling factor transporter ATP-binding protein EcfA2
LFSTSIAENIAYARPDAGQREIEAAAAAANIHDFVVSLPNGYDTPVGERGMQLSGGERQRISLARAFLKDAQVLILDEPTSSVDLETEALILEAMERLVAGRTSFMIAHRLSTLDGCDMRLEVKAGRLVRVASPPSEPHRRRLSRSRARANGTIGTAIVGARPEDLPEQAVRAWLSLGGAMPRQIPDLKEGKRFRKSAIYRLENAGPGDSPVIAKLCTRKTAEIESSVYGNVLPRLPMPSPSCYGSVRHGDTDYCWLFLEDAGAEPYSAGEPDHRQLAARWLATVQLHAGEVLEASDLPERGPRHYLVHLLNAREEIVRQLRRQHAEADGALVMEDLLSNLEVIESCWGELTAFCNALPQTLVHGDLVPKNLRIMRRGPGIGLAVFDWEMAGFGAQAPDLAQLLEPERSAAARRQRSKRFDRFSANPCLETYRSMLTSVTELEPETVELSAAVGSLFRCLAGLDWTCSEATTTWCPVDDFSVYSGWLDNAMQRLAEWSPPGQRVLELT